MGRVLRGIVFAMLLAAAPAARAADPVAEVRALLARKGPAAGTFGVHVIDARTGRVLLAVDAGTGRVPASTMKLLVTAAAWRALGPDHPFTTVVLSGSKPRPDGVLPGDLVVVGSGDPTLGSGEGKLAGLARAIRARGIRQIGGDLVLDAGGFVGPLRHPTWPADQLLRRYCAPVAALSVGRGCVLLTVKPGDRPGAAAQIFADPPTSTLRLRSEIVTCAKPKDQRIVILAGRRPGEIRCRGRIWQGSRGYPVEVAAGRPVRVFGEVLHRCLVRSGISLAGEVVERPGAAAELRPAFELGRIETPLSEVVAVANRESQNLYAESILKHLGLARKGTGSFETGAAAVREVLREAGLPLSGLVMRDGSGLSAENRVPPVLLSAVLRWMYAREDATAFLSTLARGGGAEGTLSRRLKDVGGEVRAKTGTLNGVSCLAGYVRGRSRKRVLALAVMVNDPAMGLAAARSLQDGIVRILHAGY